MASNIEFKDYSISVKNAIKEKGLKFLAEASSLIVSQTQKNTRVKTGKLKNSWNFKIDDKELLSKVGSEEENALWEEFGTGEYALNGDGRKTKWKYKDDMTGKWFLTRGKKPTRAFYKAFLSCKNTIISRAEQIFGELNND